MRTGSRSESELRRAILGGMGQDCRNLPKPVPSLQAENHGAKGILGTTNMPIDTHAILQQIDEAVSEWKDLRSRSKHDDCSDQPDNEITAVEVRLASTIDRFSPGTSYHKSSLQKILESQTYPGTFCQGS